MELATALIWTLRIVLPIVLFCIYFKLQSPKEDGYPGASKHAISRGQMLRRRQVSLQGCEVPEELRTMALKDQTQAPSLFTTSARQMRGGGRREERGAGERPPPRERRERREPRAREPREARAREAEAPEPEAPQAAEPGAGEEKMHLESLLNYVAFNRKEQQRTFLLDEEGAPPPPPPKPRRPPGAAPAAAAGTPSPDAAGPAGDSGAEKAPEEVARKANADAQLVLRGAIDFKRADVAKDIYDQLMDTNVEISERTFMLMIEASVLARDLKSASDFLMKMETSGFCPDSELLDKVMDLYAQQKQQKEQERAPAAERPAAEDAAAGQDFVAGPAPGAEMMSAGHEEVFEGPRAKLSSDARIFVPSFGIPPPPPPPGPPLGPDAGGGEPEPRTKLTAAAKPFEPQFNYTFDSYTYTWTPGGEDWGEDAGAEMNSKKGSTKQRKGAGKGANGEPKAQSKPKEKKKTEKTEKTEKPKARERGAWADAVDEPPPPGEAPAEEPRAGRRAARAWKPKHSPEAPAEEEA